MRVGVWTPFLAIALTLAAPVHGFLGAGPAYAGNSRGGGGNGGGSWSHGGGRQGGYHGAPPRGYYGGGYGQAYYAPPPRYYVPPLRYYAPYPYRYVAPRPYGYGYGYYPPPYYGGYYGNGSGSAAAIGLGVFASVAALAALSNSNSRDDDAPPPPASQNSVPQAQGYPPPAYGSAGARSPVDLCTDAAVVEASRQSGSARLGRVLSVDGSGGNLSVSGMVAVGAAANGASRGSGGGGREYDSDGFPVGSGGGGEVGFRCRTEQGRVTSLQFDNAMAAYSER